MVDLSLVVQFWQALELSAKIKIIGSVLTATAGVLAVLFQVSRFFKRRIAAKLTDPDELWKRRASPVQEDIYLDFMKKKSIPVLTIANFKGGSGKTMMAANLAACYDSMGAKVLLIDFDAHGSLSNLVGHKRELGRVGRASHLLERKKLFSKFLPHKLDSFKNTYIYDANSDLANSENRLLLQWISGQKVTGTPNRSYRDKKGFWYRLKDKFWLVMAYFNISQKIKAWWFLGALDVRFNTYNYLREDVIQAKNQEKELKKEAYHGGYDIVIIDTPSHLTPAFVNALCASTHLLIPTTPDMMSAKATVQSIETFEALRDKLRLNVRILGVVPNMIQYRTGLVSREKKSFENLAENIEVKTRCRIQQDTLRSFFDKDLKNIFVKKMEVEVDSYKGIIWHEERICNRVDVFDTDGKFWFLNSQNMQKPVIYDMFFVLAETVINRLNKDQGKNLTIILEEEISRLVAEHELKITSDVRMSYKKIVEVLSKAA